MSNKVNTTEAYIKEKIKERKMDIEYDNGREYIGNVIFNFSAKPVVEPHGDISFITGYDNNTEDVSVFLMTAQEAIDLGKMLIDTAYDAMVNKHIKEEAKLCDGRLSFLVLKGLIDSIIIERTDEELENYNPPYYRYNIMAYKNEECILSYAVVYNLSHFTSEKQIDYWRDTLTDKQRVKLVYLNWDPYKELEERKNKAQEEILEKIKNINN